MSIPRTVAEVLNNHVTLELEGIDRMYLNLYVPSLQTEKGVAAFWRFHRGHRFASSALMDPMTKDFIHRLEHFALVNAIPLITFEKNQRKDDLAQSFFASSKTEEGVVFIGKAQEKTRVFRTERRRSPNGATYPWIVRSTAMVNHWYTRGHDRSGSRESVGRQCHQGRSDPAGGLGTRWDNTLPSPTFARAAPSIRRSSTLYDCR